MIAPLALAKSELFGSMPAPLLERLAPWFTERGALRGEVLLHEGEGASRLFVIASGTVLVCKAVAGSTEALVARLGPGAHLGEIDLLDDEQATATVIMETEGTLLELDTERFRRMLVTDRALFAHVARGLFVDLATKVRRTNDKVRETIAWGLDATGDLG